ncbi:FkbM family methyltransferase [Nocardioides sp. B-3]|uniref:FkbM family methyltransferase n=1 Tax=Nocardioides sp. B-3 TaxID=2895565 RepID=UPI00215269CB|nr:FkbM family methyltransferase [Nocardioides sp. B-3]UUZ57627.1 FkbM family methyltransferase [Nocardioides sp. B-3]
MRRIAHRAFNRASWTVRRLRPDREVVRVVQGVELRLPWSHRLPDYARLAPAYGQNIVALSTALGAADPLRLIDVGANVGDTALQVLAAVDGEVLCVEGDPHWLDWLHRNVDREPRITVHPGLLWSGDDRLDLAPVRRGGTTRFAPGEADAAQVITPAALRVAHPGFDRVRLVKSDTDGHDVRLVPALAEARADASPVLFFEYDHGLSRLAGNDPLAVWPGLAAPGLCRGRDLGQPRRCPGPGATGRDVRGCDASGPDP